LGILQGAHLGRTANNWIWSDCNLGEHLPFVIDRGKPDYEPVYIVLC